MRDSVAQKDFAAFTGSTRAALTLFGYFLSDFRDNLLVAGFADNYRYRNIINVTLHSHCVLG